MENIKTKMPLGIKIILLLIGWSVLSGVIRILFLWVPYLRKILLPMEYYTLKNNIILWTNIESTIKEVFFIVAVVVLIYIIIRRFAWARTLTIALVALNIVITSIELLPLISFLTKYYNPADIITYCVTILAPLANIIISVLVILYLIKVKNFFTK